MAEENTNEQAAAQENLAPVFQMARCYLKDASLEMPHSPEIFMVAPSEQPNVDIQFEVSQRALGFQDHYEIVVRSTVTVTADGKTMFLAEAKQAGIFEIRNIPAENIHHLASVVCPQVIYPYLRANIADLINRTGLPTVHLPEVNFEALYQQRAAQAQQEAANA